MEEIVQAAIPEIQSNFTQTADTFVNQDAARVSFHENRAVYSEEN